MALYLIGDVQGCDGPLGQLLDRIDFSPSRDRLCVLGDLVNRGPASAAVLRRLMALGDAAHCLLGNHDLHLLATACGARKPGRRDTLQDVLQAPDREPLLDWLRQQSMARFDGGLLLVHAGVLPSWTVADTLSLAGEVEQVLRGPDLMDFLRDMYGNQPGRWSTDLRGAARLRVIVNALTRLRYCSVDGEMEFDTSSGPAPAGFMPWFDVPGRQTEHDSIAFGHWSTLGWLHGRDKLLSLDSGCVWGGALSALRVGGADQAHELVQLPCPQAQAPGAD
ncbi:MAG: symmetrical bis(5'-nucleosyl)-tetraphosphatase [Burkholderiales bacterium]|nr:symmetrical bis(5'-nucleosyl)-tetraphosphatase [Burkholderiales bacterium]